jgi:hypothetical protein
MSALNDGLARPRLPQAEKDRFASKAKGSPGCARSPGRLEHGLDAELSSARLRLIIPRAPASYMRMGQQSLGQTLSGDERPADLNEVRPH